MKERGLNIGRHKFGHYVFDIELHPDDDPEGLNKSVSPQELTGEDR